MCNLSLGSEGDRSVVQSSEGACISSKCLWTSDAIVKFSWYPFQNAILAYVPLRSTLLKVSFWICEVQFGRLPFILHYAVNEQRKNMSLGTINNRAQESS